MKILEICIPFIGLGINMIFQAASLKLIKGLGLLKSVFLGFSAGLIFVTGSEFYFYNIPRGGIGDFIGLLCVNLLTYTALGYTYFHYINLGETARRVRILRELTEHEGGMDEQEILAKYNSRDIIEKRLGRLLKNKQVILRDGKYYIGRPTVLWIAKIINVIKMIVFGRTKNDFN